MTIRERQTMLSSMREQHHRTCPICSDLNPNGLRAAFEVCPDGTVEAEVVCGEDEEGYAGHLHEGITAALFDSAMTNCLFSHGLRAVTGELVVRMIQPLQAGTSVVARAWLERRLPPLHVLKSELRQRDRLAARGRAKFMHKATEGGRC